jgi:hypothetical protein
MSRVWVQVDLPYLLDLESGEYGEVEVLGPAGDATRVGMWFTPDSAGAGEQYRRANHLLAETNRLIRLYRWTTRHAAVVELTLAQASPFVFLDESRNRWGPSDGEYHHGAEPVDALPLLQPAVVAGRVRALLAATAEPPVWHLLLLDAQVALDEGRFRESVLLAWSAIESCFSTHYDREVARRLGELSAEERKSLTGRDISLVNKMTAGFALATGRSLHTALGARVWRQRHATYKVRNSIIHEGAGASREQAHECLDFAQRLVHKVEEIVAA